MRRLAWAGGAGALAWWGIRAGHSTVLPAAWLAAWWFGLAIVGGALIHLWIHTLTGGRWGQAVRAPLLRIAGLMPVLALLGLPLAASLDTLYPWAHDGAWSGALSSPEFKRAWLTSSSVLLRAGLLLLLLTGLAWTTCRTDRGRSSGFAALALILYAVGVSLAAVDWLMSLTPRWSSAGFGLVVLSSQSLAGLAAAVALQRGPIDEQVRADLGNLLMAWLLMWAYLAFVQFQIIWAENLPREIAWYLPRSGGGWEIFAAVMVVAGFALPLCLLLFRRFKRNGSRLRALAAGVLIAQGAYSVWLVFPSVDPAPVARHG